MTDTLIFTADVEANANIHALSFVNKLNARIPCIGWWIHTPTESLAPNPFIVDINPDGHLNASGLVTYASKLIIVVTAGIYPIFATPKE